MTVSCECDHHSAIFDDNLDIPVIKIEWLHAKASTERFKEEVTLVKAQSGRVGRMFR